MYPICDTCIDSKELCNACRIKHEQGSISDTDINLTRVLRQMEKRQFVKNPSFTKTISMNNLLLVLTEGNVGTLVGKQGRVIKSLSKEMNKKVRIINARDFRTMVNDLVAPAKVLGINKMFKPEGEETKVVLAKGDRHKMVDDWLVMQEAANMLSERKVFFEFK